MHRTLTDATTRGGIKPSNPFVRGKAPKLVVDLTDYGYQYAGIRPLGDAEMHIRAYHFILPFHQIRPSVSETGQQLDAGHIWVPMDDVTTMVFNWSFLKSDGALSEEDRLERGLGNGPLHVDQTTFRSYANKSNNYLIDRDVQRSETFTGIEGINAQDRAIQESMGTVVDRSREHLGPADKAIIQLRKKLRDAVRAVEDGGTPEGLGTTYYDLRAGEGVLPRNADWRQELTPTMRPEQILQTV
jgi:phthalate 4,5-dioxygenase oxygenase subunit